MLNLALVESKKGCDEDGYLSIAELQCAHAAPINHRRKNVNHRRKNVKVVDVAMEMRGLKTTTSGL
jgi:hypothetical protein